MDSKLAELFTGHSVKKLEQMMAHLETCVGKLTDDVIWNRGNANENSAGNLLLHLQGNVRQWIIHAIGGAPDIRERDREFSTAGGLKREDLIGGLRETVKQAIEVINGLTAQRLAEQVAPQGRELSALEAVYQVVGHFQQHTGQVMFITKHVTGEDLGFFGPAATSAKPR
jgi:hypothetical protein